MSQPRRLIQIEQLSVGFGGQRAVRGLDLDVGAGDAVGLVGESGCGKSVTWLAALGLLPASAQVSGSVRVDGEELIGAPASRLERVRGGRVAMIFQDPASSLNPVQRIGRQIAEALALHRGLSGTAGREEVRRLLDQVGVPDAARRRDAYPHELSGGQVQRAMIAMALAGEPDLLVADEPTTALDVTIQAQILELLQRLRAETGMALVLISHDLELVADHCDRVAVMYAGRIVEEAAADTLFRAPRHPYTQGLLAALPSLEGERQRLVAIPGSVPDPLSLPPGCAFAPRCPQARPLCAVDPDSVWIAADHRAACVLAR